MDAIRLHSDGTLSSEAPFAGLLRMRLELDGDVTLRSFFRLLKRNPAPPPAAAIPASKPCASANAWN